MNSNLLTWLLGGALAASLAWHLRPAQAIEPTALDCGGCVATTGDCTAAIDGLDLSAEQQRALANWNATACGASAQHDARARELSRELYAELAAPTLDAKRARELSAAIGELRAESLRACVDSVIEVRRVLTPAQVGELLGNCCAPVQR